MRRAILILSVSLSVLALGPSAFAQDDDQKAFDAKVEDLRSLLEIAGQSGLVEMSERPETAYVEPKTGAVVTSNDLSADCLALAPLFDGGQGQFADGLFIEIANDDSEHKALARSLATLIDPAYIDQSLDVDLKNAGLCGPTFLPWQALANPGKEMKAETEAALTMALAEMDLPLQQTIGLQIAIRAGMSDNLRLARRVADTLSDVGLHNQPRHDSQPENVLLEAILRMRRDPIGARARLSWVAERDGPEQFKAIDLMRKLDTVDVNKKDLVRLADSPDPVARTNARERLLAQSIEDGEITQLAMVLQSPQQLGEEAGLKDELSVRLIDILENGSAIDAVLSLDLIERLRAQGLAIDSDLNAAARSRMRAMAASYAENETPQFTSTLEARPVPTAMNGPVLDDYLGALSEDLTKFQEALARG